MGFTFDPRRSAPHAASLTMPARSTSSSDFSQVDRLFMKAVRNLPGPLVDVLTARELPDPGLLMECPRTDPKLLGLHSLYLDVGYDAGGGASAVDSTLHSTMVATEPTFSALVHTDIVQTVHSHHADACATSTSTIAPPTRPRLRLKRGRERAEHPDGLPRATLPEHPDGLPRVTVPEHPDGLPCVTRGSESVR